MTLQTKITENMAAGYPGQWYDLSDTEAVSRTVTVSAIPFGVAVVKGETDDVIRLPDAGAVLGTATTVADNPLIGITLYHAALGDVALKNPIGNGDKAYLKITETASMAKEGRVYVEADADVKLGDPVFYRATLDDAAADPQTQRLGVLSNTANGGTNIEIPGAKWMSTSEKGELAILNLTGI